MPLSTIFISGVCGAGKSTVAWELGMVLPPAGYSVYEFDYPGVPSNTPESWRAERTETWLRTAVDNARSSISTIICGLVHPDEALAAPSAVLAPTIRFAFLEASDEEICRRLRERYQNPRYAEYLWRQEKITPEAFVPTMLPYQRQLRVLFGDPQHGTYFLDTTEATPHETARQLASWIAEQLTRGWSGPARNQLVTVGPRWAPAAQPQDVRPQNRGWTVRRTTFPDFVRGELEPRRIIVCGNEECSRGLSVLSSL
jgi:hypothetical protein